MIQEEQIRSWIEAYDRNGYLHGSILIASAGKMVVNQGFGMANWEHEIPNSPVTKFRIGSITKAFTAMCIFQLHEKQNLDLNDSIGTYLPDYPNGDRIT
ncbi:MAG: serine hydrolase domain-containing protein, partial [Clostridia bacterium]